MIATAHPKRHQSLLHTLVYRKQATSKLTSKNIQNFRPVAAQNMKVFC